MILNSFHINTLNIELIVVIVIIVIVYLYSNRDRKNIGGEFGNDREA